MVNPTSENHSSNPPSLPITEKLARYIFTQEYFSEITKEIHYSAFMPGPKDNKVSVFRIYDLKETEIWGIVKNTKSPFGPRQRENLKARGDIQAENVYTTDLILEPNPKNRHANIAGWPPPTDRTQQVNCATLLASKAILRTL